MMSSKFDDVLSKSTRPHPRVANSQAIPSGSANEGHSLPAIRLSLHDTALDHQTFEASVRQAAASGWTQISLMRRTLWRGETSSLVELLRHHQLRVSTLGWAGGFTGLSGFTYREAIADGRTALAEAVELGAETLLIAPGARGTHTYRHSQRMVTDGIKALADLAARQQIRLAVLATPSRRRFANWTSLNTLESLQPFLDSVNTPTVGLALPLHHWQHCPTAATIFSSMADRIQMVTSTSFCGVGPSAHSPHSTVLVNNEESHPERTSEATRSELKTLFTLIESGFQGEWTIEPRLNSTGTPCRSSAQKLLPAAPEYHHLLSQLRLRGGEPIARW